MMPANAPVQTRQAQRPPPAFQGREVDPQPLTEPLARLRERQLLPARGQETLLRHAVEDQHAQLPGEVVVADPRLPERGLRRTRGDPDRPHAGGAPGQAFDHGPAVWAGPPEIAV